MESFKDLLLNPCVNIELYGVGNIDKLKKYKRMTHVFDEIITVEFSNGSIIITQKPTCSDDEFHAFKKALKSLKKSQTRKKRDVGFKRDALSLSRSGPIMYSSISRAFTPDLKFPTKSSLLFGNFNNKYKTIGRNISSFLEGPKDIIRAKDLNGTTKFNNRPFVILKDGRIDTNMNEKMENLIVDDTPLNMLHTLKGYSEYNATPRINGYTLSYTTPTGKNKNLFGKFDINEEDSGLVFFFPKNTELSRL